MLYVMSLLSSNWRRGGGVDQLRRREVDDEVDIARDSLSDDIGVGEITIQIGCALMDPLGLPVRFVVDDDDVVVRNEALDQMRPNKACPAGNDYSLL